MDDLLEAAWEAARERAGFWSSDGSEAGENVRLFKVPDLHRVRVGNLEPRRLPQPLNVDSEPARLLLVRGPTSTKSPSLRKPMS